MRAGEITTGPGPCHSTGPGAPDRFAGGKGGKACKTSRSSIPWEPVLTVVVGSLATRVLGFGGVAALAREDTGTTGARLLLILGLAGVAAVRWAEGWAVARDAVNQAGASPTKGALVGAVAIVAGARSLELWTRPVPLSCWPVAIAMGPKPGPAEMASGLFSMAKGSGAMAGKGG